MHLPALKKLFYPADLKKKNSKYLFTIKIQSILCYVSIGQAETWKFGSSEHQYKCIWSDYDPTSTTHFRQFFSSFFSKSPNFNASDFYKRISVLIICTYSPYNNLQDDFFGHELKKTKHVRHIRFYIKLSTSTQIK